MTSTRTAAVRAGIEGGWVDLRNSFTNAQDITYYLFIPIVSIAALVVMGDATFRDSGAALQMLALPSILGMSIVFSGISTAAMWLHLDRDDGTLLRARATPNGIAGYLVGKSLFITGSAAVTAVLVVVPGLILFDGFEAGATAWVTLAAVFVFGMLATLPIGAVIGSLGDDPKKIDLIAMPVLATIAISGIFYPITALPGWLQAIGQILPTYWIGLGMRSALLPDSMAAVEIGGSWRHLEMIGVLGVWTVIGLILAPILLRRMARRESGANLAARRLKVLQRVQ
ncbi:ABC transporter permease [Antrihabitans sp. NCIMB 15449]|jgi:ABC-2 type transport system permease protein|uniref:ABC transporter permease n=1 Tax=Antrihabitans spumae TaxID=3373370 RepID=A0ABW7JLT0_9NOCA